jgi:hypothetical protein
MRSWWFGLTVGCIGILLFLVGQVQSQFMGVSGPVPIFLIAVGFLAVVGGWLVMARTPDGRRLRPAEVLPAFLPRVVFRRPLLVLISFLVSLVVFFGLEVAVLVAWRATGHREDQDALPYWLTAVALIIVGTLAGILWSRRGGE